MNVTRTLKEKKYGLFGDKYNFILLKGEFSYLMKMVQRNRYPNLGSYMEVVVFNLIENKWIIRSSPFTSHQLVDQEDNSAFLGFKSGFL